MRVHAATRLYLGRKASALSSVARFAAAVALALPPDALPAAGSSASITNWTYDNSGIWKRSYQEVLEYGLIGGEVVGALWEGGETRFGRTLWQSVDASAASGVVAFAMKYAFSRVRPIDSNNDPNLWFKGHGNESFPSGEVTAVSSIVTPLVLEYGPDHPLTYALEALPVYDGIARMKVQAHWQSDVIAGFALGTAAGWLHAPQSEHALYPARHAARNLRRNRQEILGDG